MSITKSKYGVPQWDGDPANFEECKAETLLYLAMLEPNKHEVVVPRLASEMTSSAKSAVRDAGAGERLGWQIRKGGTPCEASQVPPA